MIHNTERISALIITYNEMGYIEKCLESVSFADEIIVVDSYSTDGTYQFLLNHPKVKVLQKPFVNYTDQKSFALKQASNDWVLFLDADEVITEPLREELKITATRDSKHSAYWCYRKFMFQNRRLYFSGWQTDKNYRLFRKSKVRFCDKKIVHETLIVNGSSGVLHKPLMHYCYKTYTDYKNKMMKYGRLKAKEAFQQKKTFNYFSLIVKPLWKFSYNYIIRLGVLDGKKGIIVCYLNALGEGERYMELKRLWKKRQHVYSPSFR
ncbi:glycosyltransferase family 2 protein [Arenibacter lacus]|uniref:glycosyltransferase family 2 protein n=1 Tax=Arenibacter lacus TaxID=2608629 RepID=UPI00123D8F43|nr:glycosyltransferase family 2 protein [Arenibacter lacus]